MNKNISVTEPIGGVTKKDELPPVLPNVVNNELPVLNNEEEDSDDDDLPPVLPNVITKNRYLIMI